MKPVIAIIEWLVTIILIIAISSVSADARVSIEISGDCGFNCKIYRIAIEDEINEQTLFDLKHALQDERVMRSQPPSVRLDSPGGSVPVAMTIGSLLRNAGYTTGVYEHSECSSACILVLSGGVLRTAIWGKIGIHRPHFDEILFANLSQVEARKYYDEMANSVHEYLVRMGISEDLYSAMMRISSDGVRYISPTLIKAYGLDGEDAAWSEWVRARRIQLLGRDSYEIERSYLSVLLACANTTDQPDLCAAAIKKIYYRRVRSCASGSESNLIQCALQIENQMIAKYH